MTPRISARIAAIAESATLAVDAKAKALKAAGRPVIGFGAGEPDFPTPDYIVDAAAAATKVVANHRYSPTPGLPDLRDAIVAKTKRDSNYEITADQVLVTNGGKQAVYQAFATIVNPGDEVLLPSPYWTTYPEAIKLAGGKAVEVFADETQNYLVTVEQLENARTGNTKALLFCSPSNPTGRVHSVEEIQECINWSRANNSVLISDECYLEFDQTAHSYSVLSQTGGDNTNILAVHSLSKRSSMAGYRAAFMVGDSALIAKIREIRKHGGMMVPLPVQKAMTVALSDDKHVAELRARYNSRKDVLRPALEAAGFTIEFSNSGLYLWCTRNEDAWTSVAWLADRGVLATPGSFYGELGARHIRIAMTATDAQIVDAAARIKG